VDLSAMDGAPVLDHHQARSVGNVLGRVEAPRLDNGQVRARLRFSARDDVAGIVQDVRDGIISDVSVGYSVQKWRDASTGTTRARVAERWRPVEVSLVTVGKDPSAGVREMDTETEAAAAEQPQTTQAQPEQTTRTRADINREVRGIGRAAGLDQETIDGMVDRELSPDQARSEAMQALERAGGQAIQTATRVSVVQDHEAPDNVRAAMADAVAAKITGRAPEGRAAEFARWDELSMAADLAQRRGGRLDPRDRFGTAEALLTRAGQHVTSDFPALLEDAANKVFLERYQAAGPTFRQWASRRSFNDFRPHRFLRAGDFPSLKQVNEGGSLDYGTLSENRETVTAGEYARGLTIGRQMLVNGEFIQAIGDFGTLAATRTAADENAMVYNVVSGDGPTMSDGKPLFHADHNNKAGTPAPITVDSVGEAVAAMRQQTSLDGIPLNLQPRFLICGPAQELAARQVLGNINPETATNVNPWAGTMNLVVDANIEGNRWMVATSPDAAPTVVFGYVNGNVGPQIRTETDFDTQALKVRLSIDFGTGAIDHRGLFLNEGA